MKWVSHTLSDSSIPIDRCDHNSMLQYLAFDLDREAWDAYRGAVVVILFASILLLNLVAWIALRHKVTTEYRL